MSINYTPEDLVSHDGIAAVIKNDGGEIVMQEHVKYGCWTLPGGKVREGQSIIDGLKDEIREECNLEVVECVPIISKNFLYERNGKMVEVRSHLFEVTTYTGELENLEPSKHSAQAFLSLQEILKLPYLSDLTLLYLRHLGIERDARL